MRQYYSAFRYLSKEIVDVNLPLICRLQRMTTLTGFERRSQSARSMRLKDFGSSLYTSKCVHTEETLPSRADALLSKFRTLPSRCCLW
jgi:hypothetical protein